MRKGGEQIIAYADDIVLVTKKRKELESMGKDTGEAEKKIGLKINRGKTKIMILSNQMMKHTIKVGELTFGKHNR